MQKRIFCTAKRPIRPISSSRIAGFTIIELMISLMLLAVAAALSLPSYRDMIEKRQLTHGAEQILAFVNSAQLEATRQNKFVTISWDHVADNDWCFGATLRETLDNTEDDPPCKCTKETVYTESTYCSLEEVPTENSVPSVISNLNVGSRDMLKSISGDDDYNFDPVRGILVGSDPTLIVSNLIVELSSDSGSYVLNLVMNRAGNAVICSPDEDLKVPGYGLDLCPEPIN